MDEFVERPSWPADTGPFRDAVREWLEAHHDPSATVRTWWRLLADSGLTAPTWPRAHGGLGLTTKAQEVVEEALATAGCVAPPVNNDGFRAVAPALRQFSTLEQLPSRLEPLLRGEHRWTLLLDEPDRADGEVECASHRDWKYVTVTGHKRDADPFATHAVVVTRSAASASTRAGLTCYLLDLRDDAVTRDDGAVHFAELRCLPDAMIGNEHSGWEVVKFIVPSLGRGLAGRIRRGVVHVPSGELAGSLELTVEQAVATYRSDPPPVADRRQRP